MIEVKQLTVNYDKTPVLWDVHFSIPKGTLAAIVGPNGAGKSTLIKALVGVIKPAGGTVLFFGQEWKSVRHRIAYVPQRSGVDWNFPISVLDLVLMGRYGRLGLFRRPKAADRDAALHALEQVGMAPFARRQIGALSGGQQQRLFIARALLQEGDIFVLDEPFSGVDMQTEKEILQIMIALKEQGKTLLIVHHDLATVHTYFDWVVLLNKAVIAVGPIDEVFHQENMARTFGKSHALLDEVVRLAKRH